MQKHLPRSWRVPRTGRSSSTKIRFRGRQGWSKDIGHYRKPGGGKIIYRRFWLAHDQSRAAWLASLIADYHVEFVKVAGEGLWTTDHLRAINARGRSRGGRRACRGRG